MVWGSADNLVKSSVVLESCAAGGGINEAISLKLNLTFPHSLSVKFPSKEAKKYRYKKN